MSKNIVILLDGTSNKVSTDRTNILRLFKTLKKNDTQLVYYDPGVGTFGADDSASYYYRKGVEVFGLATGWGLDRNVREAYRFIAENYEHGYSSVEGGDNDEDTDHDEAANGAVEGRSADRLFLFGFSRGAYTARVLAGFIHSVGLLPKENLNLLTYAYQAYKDIGSARKPEDSVGAFDEVRLYTRTFRPVRAKIEFLGLFDTVSSVIESGRHGFRLRSHAFTRRNTSVKSVRHAVAIDERRTMFEPQLWPRAGEFRSNLFDQATSSPQEIKEVWFSGSHGDVGGGFPEEDSALAKIPLDWMIKEVKELKLQFETRTINRIVLGQHKNTGFVGPDPKAPTNQSMNWAWRFLEFVPRRKQTYDDQGELESTHWYVPKSRARVIPVGATIHRSVQERLKSDPLTAPENLPADYTVTD
jgi:uncharacterized protein (DUF2235 family)